MPPRGAARCLHHIRLEHVCQFSAIKVPTPLFDSHQAECAFYKKKKETCRAAYEFGYVLANEDQGWVVSESELNKE